METGTRYCVTVDIVWALRLPDRKLASMLVDVETKRPLAAQECRRRLVDLLRQGYDSIPACDHAKADGTCRGHKIADQQRAAVEGNGEAE